MKPTDDPGSEIDNKPETKESFSSEPTVSSTAGKPGYRSQLSQRWRKLFYKDKEPRVSSNGYDKPNVGRIFTAVSLGLAAVLAGFAGGWMQSAVSNRNAVSSSANTQRQVITSESQLINDIAKTVGQSVVSVDVTSEQSSASDLFGFTQPLAQQSAGTGIIISSDGLIITNRHVVPEGTTKVSITLSNGTKLSNVEVLGRTSQNSSLDIAFLKIQDTKGQKLVAAKIGDSAKVRVGDSVVAIGNALGQFQNTVTSGIISGYGRSVQASGDDGLSDPENLDDLFQTDAAINEGNSGGPLVNVNGEVIGINTAIAGNAENIGFAIPVNDISGLIKQIRQSGKLQQPYLGIRYVPLTADYAYRYNLKVDHGAYVAPSNGQPSILRDSPAAAAGLKEKDIIIEVDGQKIDESHSLNSLLYKHSVGDTVDLTVIRGNSTLHIKAKLAALPEG